MSTTKVTKAAPAAGEKVQVVEEKATGTALATIDYGDDAGDGLENVTREELTIPFLRILQSNSPQVVENNPLGARPGMLLNMSTMDMCDGVIGLDVIPVRRDHNFVEYVPRDSGGGFVGVIPPDNPAIVALRAKQGRFGKLINEANNEVVEVWYLYCMVRPFGDEDMPWQRVVIGFASTQIKKYQAFMGRVGSIQYKTSSGATVVPPMYAHRWRLTTQLEKNKKGQFYGWRVAMAVEPPIRSRLATDDPAYHQAREFSGLIKEGMVKAAHEQQATAGEETDEEIPF